MVNLTSQQMSRWSDVLNELLRIELPKMQLERDAMVTTSADSHVLAEIDEDLQDLRNRIKLLEELLGSAELISDSDAESADNVRIGSRVDVIAEDGTRKQFLIVPSLYEGDFRRGEIGYSSPIGRALSGHSVGETIEVHAPSGPRRYQIEGIEQSQ